MLSCGISVPFLLHSLSPHEQSCAFFLKPVKGNGISPSVSTLLAPDSPDFDSVARQFPSQNHASQTDRQREYGHGIQAIALNRDNDIARAVHEQDAAGR